MEDTFSSTPTLLIAISWEPGVDGPLLMKSGVAFIVPTLTPLFGEATPPPFFHCADAPSYPDSADVQRLIRRILLIRRLIPKQATGRPAISQTRSKNRRQSDGIRMTHIHVFLPEETLSIVVLTLYKKNHIHQVEREKPGRLTRKGSARLVSREKGKKQRSESV